MKRIYNKYLDGRGESVKVKGIKEAARGMLGRKDIRSLLPYLPFVLFFVYSFAIHANASMKAYDDYVYKSAWADISVWEWCKSFYLGWSGRVPLQALDIIFLQFPIWAWRIWNTVIFAACPILVSGMGRMLSNDLDSRQRFVANGVVCAMFLLLPKNSMDGAVLWISGSFNYLLPCAGLLMALQPFFAVLYGKKMEKRFYVFSAIGVFLCCFAEQTAAVFLCLTVIILSFVLMEKKRVRALPFLELLGIVCAAILFLAPGNNVRYVSEVPLWNKAYDMYSFVDKLILGYVHCIRMIFLHGWIFILVLVGLMVFALKRRSLLYKGLYALYALFTCGMMVLVYRIENESFVFLIGNVNSMIYLFLITSWLVLLAMFLFTTFESEPKTGAMLAFLVLGAFAAGTVVAMSPSIFEAKLRVFFVPYVMLIFAIGLELAAVFGARTCRATTGR